MKAVLLSAHGGPELMRYADAPDPVAGAGEVVIDIHAASVNGADYKVRLGNGRYKLDKFPHILLAPAQPISKSAMPYSA
jgi:NADPH:quinone reductase-like Zn-dependent oxidoreductase